MIHVAFFWGCSMMVSDGTIEVNLVFHQVKAVIFSEM